MEGNDKLKGFLRNYLTGILNSKNGSRGPYRYWIQNTDERGFIGLETIMNAHVMKRSEEQHDSRKGAGYFRSVLKGVLSEAPFEMNGAGTRWRMRNGAGAAAAAGGDSRAAENFPPLPSRAAAARTPAEVWAAAGSANSMRRMEQLAATSGSFVPGQGVQYTAWNARAAHSSPEAAYETRSVFMGQPNLRPVNSEEKTNFTGAIGGRRRRVGRTRVAKKRGRSGTRRRRAGRR